MAIFCISIWHYMLSLRKVLTPIDVLNYRSSHLWNLTAKYKFIFFWVSSLALPSSLLKVPNVMTFQPWAPWPSSKAGLQNVFVGSVGIQLCFNIFVLLNVFNFVLFSLDDLLMGGISAHVSFLIILITVLKKTVL